MGVASIRAPSAVSMPMEPETPLSIPITVRMGHFFFLAGTGSGRPKCFLSALFTTQLTLRSSRRASRCVAANTGFVNTTLVVMLFFVSLIVCGTVLRVQTLHEGSSNELSTLVNSYRYPVLTINTRGVVKVVTMTKRARHTVTRSISFDKEVFKAMEEDRKRLRLDRSQYLRSVLENQLGMVTPLGLKAGGGRADK